MLSTADDEFVSPRDEVLPTVTPGLETSNVTNPYIMTVNASATVVLVVECDSDVFQRVTFLGFPSTPPVIFTGTGMGTLLTTSSGATSTNIPPSVTPYQMGVIFQWSPNAVTLPNVGFIGFPPSFRTFGNMTIVDVFSNNIANVTQGDHVTAIITLLQS